ncbi:MAG: YeeE/YedE thiosulfate transporter family protein [Acetobacteraceae bacterium]
MSATMSGTAPIASPRSLLRERAWSPYVAGAVIGLLQIPTFLLLSTALGASSSFVTVGAHLASIVDPGVGQVKYLASHLWGGKNWWQVAVVVGIALGAFLSMRLSGARRPAVSRVWGRAMGTSSLATRAPVAFVAGFIMLFGARIAGGCTSGHGISGMAQLSVGSTLAVIGMFAGGILTAMLFRRA